MEQYRRAAGIDRMEGIIMADVFKGIEPMVYKSRISVPYHWWAGETASRFLVALRDAEFAASACYADGIGTPRDLVEACKWAALAAAHGVEEAAIFKAATEKKLTPEQKAKADQVIAEALKAKGNPKE